MKAYDGVNLYIRILLTSSLAGDEWSVSCPGRFIPWEEPPLSIEYEVGWTPEPVWTTWKRKYSWPSKDSNSDTSVQPVADRYTDYAIPQCTRILEMRSSMFSAQLTTLWCRSTNSLAGLNLNIAGEVREYFRLTDFWVTLYIFKARNYIRKWTPHLRAPYSEVHFNIILHSA
jgi:hypothetical protein